MGSFIETLMVVWIFIFVFHVLLYVYVCVFTGVLQTCACVWKSESSLRFGFAGADCQFFFVVFLFFDTEVSYFPQIYQIGLPDRAVSTRDKPVSISLALGLQVCVPSLSFLNVSFGN